MMPSLHADRSGGRPALPPPSQRRQLPPDGGPDFNRLIFEQSPYLLQHARNPVDWRPWGDEAFAAARRDNKPIFLSIGYATCHWCHVMEHESFENAAIAAVLNEHFVCIKIDREERPDIDAVYMSYVQAATGGGGWPLSVWLTPDLKPFMGGTYFPPDDSRGHPGLRSLLIQIATAWKENHARILAGSDQVTQRLREYAASAPAETAALSDALLTAAFEEIASSFEPQFGGFGSAPKFPRPAAPNFLLRYHARTGSAPARDMTQFSLRHMARGGVYDHLGGGFHRYAVDGRWHVPHFEKMLYDQGQLVCTYLEAWQCTQDPQFAAIARGILDYVRTDLTAPDGGFYSAEDADSPVPTAPATRAEGAFYVWDHAEILRILAPALAPLFCRHYGVKPDGNVRSDPHGEFTGKNVLMAMESIEESARAFNLPPATAAERLATARRQLLAARIQRPHPQRDDKIITAWNGLMISAYARAFQILHDPADLAAAQRAADWLHQRHVDPVSRRLLRRSLDGIAGIPAFAEDYAFLIQGLLDLYEAGANAASLAWAIELQDQMDTFFSDTTAGGYFRTSGEDVTVLVRMKEEYDGAEPAAGSIAAMNLLRLAHMLNRPDYAQRAAGTLESVAARLAASPSTMPQMLVALDTFLHPPAQVVIAGDPQSADALALRRVVHARHRPGLVLLAADGAAGQALLATHNPIITDLRPQAGRATAYLCENFTCKLPTTTPTELATLLAAH